MSDSANHSRFLPRELTNYCRAGGGASCDSWCIAVVCVAIVGVPPVLKIFTSLLLRHRQRERARQRSFFDTAVRRCFRLQSGGFNAKENHIAAFVVWRIRVFVCGVCLETSFLHSSKRWRNWLDNSDNQSEMKNGTSQFGPWFSFTSNLDAELQVSWNQSGDMIPNAEMNMSFMSFPQMI